MRWQMERRMVAVAATAVSTVMVLWLAASPLLATNVVAGSDLFITPAPYVGGEGEAYDEPRDPQGCCFPDGSCKNMEPDDCINTGGTPVIGFCYGTQWACCFGDGSCIMADPICCESELGGTPVYGEVCVGETQACCFYSGMSATCMDADPTCCQDMGGDPQGPGTACTVEEACCFPDGTCEMVDPLCCDGLGGVPAGPDSVCEWVTEACCFGDGSCMEVDGACCEALGGWSSPTGEEHCLGDGNGNGTDDACEEPEACCLLGGGCTDLPAYSCEQMLGIPQGAGTMCTQAEACCLEDGTCEMVDPLCCDELGGVPQGPGTACTELEACCLDDGTCLDVDPLCCDELGGTAQGDGTACSATTIACCLDDGAICMDVDPLCCDDLGGSPGYASMCIGDLDSNGIDDACEPQLLQACCLENGNCLDATHDVCIFVHNGTPQGPGTACPVAVACCLDDGLGTCTMVDPLCCDELGGVTQGPGTMCTVAEACCLDDALGTCEMVDPLCCDELGGVAQGPGTQCGFVWACCLEDGTCMMADPLCCDELGGVAQGPGMVCTQPEACCLEDGTCEMVDPLCCDEMGGVAQGWGTVCTEPEACCLDDGACADLDPLCCEYVGGWPSPIGEPYCLGDQNGNGIDDACDEPVSKWTQWPHGPEEGFDAASGYWWYEPPPKWEQEPDLTSNGMGVDVTTNSIILADDFECTVAEPITKIRLWGSWLWDYLPYGDPTAVGFTLSIHEDLPVGHPDNPFDYSIPGNVFWTRYFWPGQFDVFLYADNRDEGWFDPESNDYEPSADTMCWQYDFHIDEAEAFHQLGTPEEPIVYWLDVQANPMDADARFGWKTSVDHWNDDGVWGQGEEPYPGPWFELRYPPGHPWEDDSIDLAFRIASTTTVSKPWPNKVVADDFVSDGRPIEALRWWGSYLDPQYAPESVPVEPYILDGWFISFHHADPVLNPECPPDFVAGDPHPTVLGVYFAPAGAVRIDSLGITDCFGHDVYEYFIDLDQCCLICSEEDPRPEANPSDPACAGEFLETADLGYWVGIEAVVGAEWLPESDPLCFKTLTGHRPSDVTTNGHFWGWHTSPDENLEEACTGAIYDLSPYPPDCWEYGNWVKQPWLCDEMPPFPPVHMAFQLLTSESLPTCYCRDVNCDGFIDSLDLGAVKNPANWLLPVPPAANPLADVNRDGIVDALDLGAIKNPIYWMTNPHPGGCTCSNYTPDYTIDCPME